MPRTNRSPGSSWRDAELDNRARAAAADIGASLELARHLGPVADALGTDTWAYLRALATLGAADLTTARVVEPHVDALAIIAQAGQPDLSAVHADPGSTWGVYAANAPGHEVVATHADGSWRLDGTKPWCSLADRVSHALVTCVVVDEGPGLFAVDLRHEGIAVDAGGWVSRGLRDVTTSTLRVDAGPAVPVGNPGWYLSRPGFAWGGIGVAAVWFGGAWAVADRLVRAARQRPPDQVALMHLGHCDAILHGVEVALRDAAQRIDRGAAEGAAGQVLGARVRAQAAYASEEVLRVVGHALGPAPLTQEVEHARRAADLTVYVRQHHGERDLAALGSMLLSLEDGR